MEWQQNNSPLFLGELCSPYWWCCGWPPAGYDSAQEPQDPQLGEVPVVGLSGNLPGDAPHSHHLELCSNIWKLIKLWPKGSLWVNPNILLRGANMANVQLCWVTVAIVQLCGAAVHIVQLCRTTVAFVQLCWATIDIVQLCGQSLNAWAFLGVSFARATC